MVVKPVVFIQRVPFFKYRSHTLSFPKLTFVALLKKKCIHALLLFAELFNYPLTRIVGKFNILFLEIALEYRKKQKTNKTKNSTDIYNHRREEFGHYDI